MYQRETDPPPPFKAPRAPCCGHVTTRSWNCMRPYARSATGRERGVQKHYAQFGDPCVYVYMYICIHICIVESRESFARAQFSSRATVKCNDGPAQQWASTAGLD